MNHASHLARIEQAVRRRTVKSNRTQRRTLGEPPISAPAIRSKRRAKASKAKVAHLAPPSRNGHSQATEPDSAKALELVKHLMTIPGPSRHEGLVMRYVKDRLRAAKAGKLIVDPVHQRAPGGGETGNLILKLPGTLRGPRRLLMAHVDTVPLCVGSIPVEEDGFVRSGNPQSGLGADDRAGAAVVLNTALEILERRLPHYPTTFLWTVQEEIGLYGAHYAKLGLLGRPKLAFNFDGSAAEKVILGATGAYRMKIAIDGVASHAGGAPEAGVSAIAIAGVAIADLQQHGWHGAIRKGRHTGTSNVGSIQGGLATNVVAPRVELKAEARSHDPQFRLRIVEAIEQAFRRAASLVRNTHGVGGKVTIGRRLDYEAFQLAQDEPCIGLAEAAIRDVGLEPIRAISHGGLDANWLTARGIPTVTLGCGQQHVHTLAERLNVAAFQNACRIALRLTTMAG